ncbi:MAG: CoA transferase [Subtercola sp.]|nr:CoA transferase [Subtercola sp.]
MPRPLDGMTVVSLEQAVSAPFATRQLADLGARVIKIEREAGDFARGYDDRVNGLASYFVWLNRSKESVVLDLKSADELDDLKELIRTADIVVQNLAPGAVERLGIGPDDALALNPALIYASISGYGSSGPYRSKKAYDLLIQCEAGLLSVTGTAQTPSKVGVSIADIAAGMYAYSGILSAVIQRGRTGQGQKLEISMLEALAEWMSQPELYAAYGGAAPARTGASHASIAPYGPFACDDGTVFLAVQNEREWRRFCTQVLGDEPLADDARFANNTLRVTNRVALLAAIEPVLSRLTRDEVVGRLDAAEIANAALRDMGGLTGHPQLAARHRWRQIDTPNGEARVLLPAVTAQWQPVMGAVPALGADTTRIRGEIEAMRESRRAHNIM